MSVLCGFGENEGFEMLGGSVITTPGFYRANARCAIKASGAGLQHTFTGKLKAYLDAQPADDKDFYYSFVFRGGGGFITGMDCFYMHDATNRPFLRLTGNSTAGGLLLWTSVDGGTTWVQYPGSSVVQPGVPTQIAFRVKVHATLGHVAMYYGSALLYQTPPFDTRGFCNGSSPAKTRFFIPNSNSDGYYSEVLASSADDPLIGWKLTTMPLVALGALQQWAGAVTAVNEIDKDQTTAQSTASALNDESFTTPGTFALGAGEEVRAVIWSGEYRTAVAPAPQNVSGFLRIGGVVYPDTPQLVDLVPGLRQFIWETNPDPGVPPDTKFSAAVINAMQPGNRSIA